MPEPTFDRTRVFAERIAIELAARTNDGRPITDDATVLWIERQLQQLVSREPEISTTRKVSIKKAMTEILQLFRERKQLFYSDIAEALNLDFSTVIEACDRLQRQNLIEGAAANE
jgi:shikimate kinase